MINRPCIIVLSGVDSMALRDALSMTPGNVLGGEESCYPVGVSMNGVYSLIGPELPRQIEEPPLALLLCLII